MELSHNVVDIYNESLEQGFVPTQLKEALFRALPNSKSIENDSHAIKLMEAFTLDNLYIIKYSISWTINSLLTGKPTLHAIVYLLNCILESLDRGNCFARIIFTDFSKGFDLLVHKFLVEELRALKDHEVLIRWLGSFLSKHF